MLDKDLTLHIQDGEVNLSPDPANQLRFEKEVVYVGSFAQWDPNGKLAMQFDVDETDIDNWIAQHDAQIAAGLEVVMPVGHTTDPRARGADAIKLTKKLDSKGRLGLFVLGEFKDEKSKQDLAKSQVSLFSPPAFKHGANAFRRPIRHIAFTDNPVVGGLDRLQTIAASYVQEKTEMRKLAESLGLKLSADLTDDEIRAKIKEYNDELQVRAAKLAEPETPVAPVAPETISASTDPVVLNLSRDNRRMKIQQLVVARKATPAEATKLEQRWAGNDLSLSTDACTAFDSIIASYTDREPIRELDGHTKTGPQTYDREKNSLARAAKNINERSARN